MTVHRITCNSRAEHMARALAESDHLPESLLGFVDRTELDYAAERALIGEGPESADPITAAKAWADAAPGEWTEAWGR